MSATQLALDLEEEARRLLPAHVAGYVAASAGDGACHAEGLADWAALRLVPRVLRGTGAASTATTVLGTPVRTPVLLAPMAQQVAAHPLGEAEAARAVAAAGGLLGVSTNTAVPFEQVTAAGAPWWYQVYVLRDRSLTALLVERAAAAGATALVLTVDTTALAQPAGPAGGAGPASIEPTEWPAGPGRERLTALTAADLADRSEGAASPALDLDLGTIGWLAERSGLPVVVKGVLHPADATACVEAGAAGVVVSTHGGRRLGASVTSAQALAGVVSAVRATGTGAEVYADSGVRSGAAVAAALALGARAVFVGRPAWWGLAARGADGVAAVLGALTDELALALRQCGADAVGDLSADLVVPRERRRA